MSPIPAPRPIWRAALSAACASLIGIGIARFAYAPLLPAIIAARWFAAPDAAYLGAANLAGYLLGVLMVGPLARRTSARTVLRVMMVVTTTSILACAWPVNFAWFFAWRLISGVGGAAMMILAAPAVLPHVAPGRRGVVSGLIFMGIGIGVAASGTLVPLLLRQGLTQTWLGLGFICLVLTVVAWNGWPAPLTPAAPPARRPRRPRPRRPALWALHLEYGLNAVGMVPHMIFLVAFVARGLGQGLDAGAFYWVMFGLGAVVGPLLAGRLADSVGFTAALRLAFLVEALAAVTPALNHAPWALIASSAIMGASTPGVVALVLGRAHQLAGRRGEAQGAAWRAATTSFALGQALAAYAMSYVLSHTGGDYALIFELGAGAILLALLIDLGAGVVTQRARPKSPAG